jgi:hypothetical protein
MTNATLTPELLATLDTRQLRQLENIPEFKEVVLNFRTSLNADLIEFSNRGSWEVMGITVTELTIMAVLDSGLAITKEDHAYNTSGQFPLGAQFFDALRALDEKIQMGKQAQGIKYARTTKNDVDGNRRARLEAILASA